MKFTKKCVGCLSVLFALPMVASAQTAFTIIETVQRILQTIPPILIGLAVIAFMVGVVKYVVAKDPEKQKEARSVMIYGIIVITVMVSIWGLVAIVRGTFGLDGSNPAQNTNLIPAATQN